MRHLASARLCLDRLTMHRLVLLALAAMLAWGVALSMIGALDYRWWDVTGAGALAVGVTVGGNRVLAKLFRAPFDPDSSVITGLILALLVPPGLREHGAYLAGAGLLAVGSKYLVTVDRQHIFNPAAIGLVAMPMLFPGWHATWWVGTAPMLPAVAACGALVVMKTRRGSVATTFLVVVLLIASASTFVKSGEALAGADAVATTLISTALVFFAFVMLTDPIAIPAGRAGRHGYALLVGLLYATPDISFLPVALAPEAALCVGNAVSFVARPRFRALLPLKRRGELAPSAWSVRFPRPPGLAFRPGQFMEWTVPHARPDGRGQRRYFTIASSPTEADLEIVMRLPQHPSSYKRALLGDGARQGVIASRLSGDFVLPRDLRKPMAFVASGVGVAPFRSMARYIVDKSLSCDVVLLSSHRSAADVLYGSDFDAARPYGWRTAQFLTGNSAAPDGPGWRRGRITARSIAEEVPDFRDRVFYVSGSHRFVSAVEEALRQLKVRRGRIRRDFFDGLVEA